MYYKKIHCDHFYNIEKLGKKGKCSAIGKYVTILWYKPILEYSAVVN